MRVAALYDIHGNLPALEAVLAEVRLTGVDLVLIGGDVLPGPMPGETLDALLDLEIPARFIVGNGEAAVLAERPGAEGTTLPEKVRETLRWTAGQLLPAHETWILGWPRTLRVEIPGLGETLFCHATPRSDTEIFTRQTPEDRLAPAFAGVDATLVVCGHTHMQLDRKVGAIRVVNAGSVGMPFGRPGADWLLLGPGVELRHTAYDLPRAAARIRATSYPEAAEFADRDILSPRSESEMLELFARAELR
ncbi:MAG: phosphoesterase [Acidobacteria bacterium]|nr:MAG: phosphoesterase [Acidobacteriota bacterium]